MAANLAPVFGSPSSTYETNAKALFGLAMTDWQDGNYSDAVSHFSAIRPSRKRCIPMRSTTTPAAKMFLGALPLSGKVIYLLRDDGYRWMKNVV